MSYTIRQVALKSDGSEIIRSAQDASDEISIGRLSSNAVHLPDLAVSPVHASVKKIDSGKILVESQSGLSFDLDGRSTGSAEIEAARGGELRFGGHVIAIGVDSDTGNVSLTVRRVEALSDSAEDKDEGTIYSLAGLLPSKRMSAWAFVALVLAAFLAWPIYTWSTYKPLAYDKDAARPAGFHADKMWLSGQLSKGHASLKDNCQACHVDAFVAVRDNACMTCHKNDAHEHAPIARQVAARGQPEGFAKFTRFVATEFNKPQGRCVECHSEHEGAGAMEPTQQQFCADCHDGIGKRLKDTTLLSASDFGVAHPQFRPAVMTSPIGDKPPTRRISLDKKPIENNGLKFPHDVHLSKTGGVAQMGRRLSAKFGFGAAMDCADCHTPTSDGVRFKEVDMEKNCSMCHSLSFDKIDGTFRTLRHGEPEQVKADLRAYFRSTGPTRPINLGGMARRRPGSVNAVRTASDYARAVQFRPSRADEAIRQVFSKGGACYDCHTVTLAGGGLNYKIEDVHQPSRYMLKGWFDHAAHDKEDCSTCHAAKTSGEATQLLIPGIATCRECHVGGTGEKLVSVKKPVKSNCSMCHDYHADDGAPWLIKEQGKKKTIAWGESKNTRGKDKGS